ncbi:MAG: cation diffusion facilitator family transporter [Solirubrobacterales bacterium]|nr:cation diffusion facilitator family transporter [Solirubrobacterales bacterium]
MGNRRQAIHTDRGHDHRHDDGGHVQDEADGHGPSRGPTRHGHSHNHSHSHSHNDEHGHGHSHGLVDESIKRSSEGVRAVSISLGVLLVTAALQAVVFVSTGSVALLADLIHNFGDALTAIPLGAAFLLRSRLAEKRAGYFVVATIFVSAAVAGIEAVNRLIHPQPITHLGILALAGAIGFTGNEIAARVRLAAGRRLDSPALIADGNHARVDGLVSLAVVASAAVVALGLTIADPLIGLTITVVILRITRDSWRTISASGPVANAGAPVETVDLDLRR